MTKKKNTESYTAVRKLKLYNSATQELMIIADEEMVNYDVRLWQVVK
jgi:hypothetical protein